MNRQRLRNPTLHEQKLRKKIRDEERTKARTKVGRKTRRRHSTHFFSSSYRT